MVIQVVAFGPKMLFVDEFTEGRRATPPSYFSHADPLAADCSAALFCSVSHSPHNIRHMLNECDAFQKSITLPHTCDTHACILFDHVAASADKFCKKAFHKRKTTTRNFKLNLQLWTCKTRLQSTVNYKVLTH